MVFLKKECSFSPSEHLRKTWIERTILKLWVSSQQEKALIGFWTFGVLLEIAEVKKQQLTYFDALYLWSALLKCATIY